jgi:hypothetical protein
MLEDRPVLLLLLLLLLLLEEVPLDLVAALLLLLLLRAVVVVVNADVRSTALSVAVVPFLPRAIGQELLLLVASQ